MKKGVNASVKYCWSISNLTLADVKWNSAIGKIFQMSNDQFNTLFNRLLTISLLMTTQEAFVDSVDQDQTAQNVQSDLWSTLSTFSF